MVFLVVLGVVFLAPVPAVALPLLLPVLKPSPGPPKPPPGPPKTPPGPPIVFFICFFFICFLRDNMRSLRHPGSDLDETWWIFFPGVSRSFLNSSGTKITTKNNEKMKFKISKKIQNFNDYLHLSVGFLGFPLQATCPFWADGHGPAGVPCQSIGAPAGGGSVRTF